MLSSPFKSEFQNRINTEGQIYRGIGGAVQTVSAGILSAASVGKMSVAGFSQERVSSVRESMIKDEMLDPSVRTRTDVAMENVAGQLKTEDEFKTLDTVYNKLQKEADKRKEAEMTKRIEDEYRRVGKI